jgi:hypothetical protein
LWMKISGKLSIPKTSLWGPIPLRDWEERNSVASLDLSDHIPLAGSRFVSERLNPSGFPGNGSLDDVRSGFECQ